MAATDFKPLRILVVDPNEHLRRIAQLLLLDLGTREVLEAEDGEGAVETLLRAKPDMVFVDLDMADGKGLALIRALRDTRTSPNAYVPIVAMSAHTVRALVMAARDAGATEYLAKPFSARSIAERIANIVHNPRPFVRTRGFFGPDRRRFVHPNYAAQERRQDTAARVAIGNVIPLKPRLTR